MTDTFGQVVSFADMPRLRETLPSMSNQLDVCQRALSDFLEEKRAVFPRFYFIGDDDLLEILGQAKNPEVIQTHLKKLFAGIHKVIAVQTPRQYSPIVLPLPWSWSCLNLPNVETHRWCSATATSQSPRCSLWRASVCRC